MPELVWLHPMDLSHTCSNCRILFPEELHICDRCEEPYCYECGAKSTQHHIVDYNCCKSCDDYSKEY